MVALAVGFGTSAEKMRGSNHEIDRYDLHWSIGAMRHRHHELARPTVHERQPRIRETWAIDLTRLRITHDSSRAKHDLRQLPSPLEHGFDRRQRLIQPTTKGLPAAQLVFENQPRARAAHGHAGEQDQTA